MDSNHQSFKESGKILILIVLSVCILPLYVYYNPVRWDAIYYRCTDILSILRFYTLYGHALELLFIVWLWVVGYVLGTFVLHILFRIQIKPLFSIYIGTGWGFLSFALFFFALAQSLNRITVWGLLFFFPVGVIIILVFCRPSVLAGWSPIHLRWWKLPRQTGQEITPLILLFIFVPLFYSFFSSLMPPTQSDGLRYHLTIPKLYLERGGFYLIPSIAFSNFPFLIEYLYAIPIALTIDSGAKLIHFSYFLLTLSVIYELGKKFDHPRDSMLSVMVFACIPFVPFLASWSFIELGLTFYTVAGFYVFLVYLELIDQSQSTRFQRDAIILLGILSGFLLGCKYTALATVGLLFGLMMLSRIKVRPFMLLLNPAHSILYLTIALIVASPWYIKNYVLLGNPVYPFAGGWFATPFWTEFNDLFFRFHAGLKGSLLSLQDATLWQKVGDFITLPFRVTFFPGERAHRHPEDFGSWPIGCLWLLIVPFVAIANRWNKRTVLYAIVSFFLFVVWAYTYRDTRFLLPCFAVAVPFMVHAFNYCFANSRLARTVLFAGVFYNICFMTGLIFLPFEYSPWAVVGGAYTKETYLTEISSFTRELNQAYRYLETHADPDDLVLLHGIEYTYYCPNPYIGADWFNTDPLLEWSWNHADPQELKEFIQNQNIKYIVYHYGKIKSPNHFFFYRLFRLPPDKSYPLLKELVEKQYALRYYPLVYEEWWNRFQTKLEAIEREIPEPIAAVEAVLENGFFEEVFRYDPDLKEIGNGIVVLKVESHSNSG